MFKDSLVAKFRQEAMVHHIFETNQIKSMFKLIILAYLLA